ncbi:hypothetical protein HYALB_00013434 [Hymenoscyphus albidus]|uniref:Uncharacterized protein n=1 Tax=Hymenoscyphus albidus TaxID=595503 RepID=A0A9N9Q9W3_9HELO|nr:hypothetical protein HYALB_00013434 [Hymenoscyphus albidus]
MMPKQAGKSSPQTSLVSPVSPPEPEPVPIPSAYGRNVSYNHTSSPNDTKVQVPPAHANEKHQGNVDIALN